MRQLNCHVGIGPDTEGEALVANDNFSARYDLDRLKGIFRVRSTSSWGSPTRTRSWS